MYRLNTYPLIHLGFVHALLNVLAITPLLERFEADQGTLLTAAMFVGRTFCASVEQQAEAEADTLSLYSAVYPSRGRISLDRTWYIERK